MTHLETRAVAYLKTIYGNLRPIIVNPEGHEPGFYHEIHPDRGASYLTQRATLSGPGGTYLIDTTGDEQSILCVL